MKLIDEDKNIDSNADPSAAYERYKCAAEVLVPYRIPGGKRGLLAAWRQTRFKGPLWNMDFPWLAVMMTAFFGVSVSVILSSAKSYFLGRSYIESLHLIAMFPIFFTLLSPLVYPLLVALNLRLGWGKSWTSRLLGPSHIGLTDSGFKLYFRGRLFYCYPTLALWQEIFDCELEADTAYDTVTLRYIYQSGFGRVTIYIPLNGFSSPEDLKLVLRHFAERVNPGCQSETLKAMSQVDFVPVIEAVERKELSMFPPGDTSKKGARGNWLDLSRQ